MKEEDSIFSKENLRQIILDITNYKTIFQNSFALEVLNNEKYIGKFKAIFLMSTQPYLRLFWNKKLKVLILFSCYGLV